MPLPGMPWWASYPTSCRENGPGLEDGCFPPDRLCGETTLCPATEMFHHARESRCSHFLLHHQARATNLQTFATAGGKPESTRSRASRVLLSPESPEGQGSIQVGPWCWPSLLRRKTEPRRAVTGDRQPHGVSNFCGQTPHPVCGAGRSRGHSQNTRAGPQSSRRGHSDPPRTVSAGFSPGRFQAKPPVASRGSRGRLCPVIQQPVKQAKQPKPGHAVHLPTWVRPRLNHPPCS